MEKAPHKKRGRKPDGDENKIDVYTCLPPDLIETLRAIADEKKISLSKLINDTLESVYLPTENINQD